MESVSISCNRSFAVINVLHIIGHATRLSHKAIYLSLCLSVRSFVSLMTSTDISHSRPESVLHPKGSSKSYISLNLRKVLDEAGRDSFVDDLHELVCASTRGQQITQEQMRRVNVDVTNALELRREVEARAAQLKALEAEINARADQVEARAAQLEKEMTLVHAMV